MKNTALLFFAIFAFILSDLEIAYAQEARVYGRIFMPAVKKKKKTSRGRLYRNRLSSGSRSSKSKTVAQSSYQDVIIAAFPLSFKADVKPLKKARVLQRNAKFIPNVLPVTPGTKVEFINLDRFFHNVFSISPGARFNIGRRPTNAIVQKTINKKGSINLFCDIHSQMNATIVSLDTPYFTTANNNGVYLIDNLPDGKYRIEVIHPSFGTVQKVINISKNDSIEESFTLSN